MTFLWLIARILLGVTLWIVIGYAVAIVFVYGVEKLLQIVFRERR